MRALSFQLVLDSVKQWLTKPHAKQLGAVAAIATTGIFSGSLVAVKGAAQVLPSPIPSPIIEVPSTEPIVPAVVHAIPSPIPSPIPTRLPKIVKPNPKPSPKRTNFKWGITIMPFPFREENEKILPEQFRLAAELGLNVVRVEYSPQNDKMNRLVLEQAQKYGLTLVFIIPFGPNDIFTDEKLYDNAYRYVADIVQKHNGQVPIWQMANEVASVALIDGQHHGIDRKDYPEDKYKAVSTWLKAASKAIKDNDPNAKRLVTDHWVHTGFFDRFLAEGGEFEILGWNWFSDMGKDMDRVILDKNTGQRYKLLSKLKTYKKELWLTEVNQRLGSNGGGEKSQADYIQAMAEYAYANPALTGFLVFNLIEDQTARIEETGYSLVNVDLERRWVSGLKQAFRRYEGLIKAKKH